MLRHLCSEEMLRLERALWCPERWFVLRRRRTARMALKAPSCAKLKICGWVQNKSESAEQTEHKYGGLVTCVARLGGGQSAARLGKNTCLLFFFGV